MADENILELLSEHLVWDHNEHINKCCDLCWGTWGKYWGTGCYADSDSLCGAPSFDKMLS